jgi:hypothetical protein
MKEVLKDQAKEAAEDPSKAAAPGEKQILSRTIPQAIVSFYANKIAELQPEIQRLSDQVGQVYSW